jgi:hypothetical protein
VSLTDPGVVQRDYSSEARLLERRTRSTLSAWSVSPGPTSDWTTSRTGWTRGARVDADMRELRAEIGGLGLALLRVGGGIIIGLVGVIAAILVSPVGG